MSIDTLERWTAVLPAGTASPSTVTVDGNAPTRAAICVDVCPPMPRFAKVRLFSMPDKIAG
jgi:hypothetical protein